MTLKWLTRTVTHEKDFYFEFYEKYKIPFVRMAPATKHRRDIKLKDHRVSKVFGLVCVSQNCPHGDVHRHPEDERKMVDDGRELRGSEGHSSDDEEVSPRQDVE